MDCCLVSLIDLPHFPSVQFSHSVMSDSFRPHGPQHTRPPCPSPTPGFTQTHVHWVGDAIQPCSPVIPFSSCPQSPPASGSFSTSQFFISGGLSIRASASVFPINIQGWFPLELVGLISLLSKGLSRVFSRTTIWKHQFFGTQTSLWSHSHMRTLLPMSPGSFKKRSEGLWSEMLLV